jgi:hypothetical protein
MKNTLLNSDNGNDIEYFPYNIEHQGYTEITREADPEEDYDGDDTFTDWSISDVITNGDKKSYDFVAPFQLEDNTKYYLVYIIYSTGDSFSHQANANCEFIDLFKTKEQAEKLVTKIKSDNEKDEPFYMDYHDEANQLRRVSCSWNGYFESITTCEVKEVSLPVLKDKLKSKFKNMV